MRPGDLVMVHASLRAIGPVRGRADGLIDALAAAVGPGGTLVMVLGARDDFAWVNERPEDERMALLADAPAFDADESEADPEMGVLPEVFRQRPDVLVSDHPDARFGALGRLATALVSDVPWDDYYGAGSPLERLFEADGRVLRLGADANTVTLIHYAEHLVERPDKIRVRRHHRVTSADGPVIRLVDTLDDVHGIAPYPGEDYFADLLRDYLATGAARTGRFGDARSELIDARSLVPFAVDWLHENL